MGRHRERSEAIQQGSGGMTGLPRRYAPRNDGLQSRADHDYMPGLTRRLALKSPPAICAWDKMDRDARLKRLRFRSCHRGVREADLLVGSYFDRWHRDWSDADMDWFEAFLEEQDVDILAWAMGTVEVPARWQGAMMTRLQALDYIRHP